MILYLASKNLGDKSFFEEWINKHNNKLLLIFNALDAKVKEKIEKNVNEEIHLLEQIGFEVCTLDLKDYFDRPLELEQICEKYCTLCVMGGNVFVLRQAMKYSGLDSFLKDKQNDNDFLYIGQSAGACVLSDKIDIYKIVDEPIGFYRNEIFYDGLGLINYAFIPHYKSNYHKVHLVDETVEKCESENIKFKAFNDEEIIIEKTI